MSVGTILPVPCPICPTNTGKSPNWVSLSTVNIQEITQVEVETRERENTSDVGGGNEDQACQLSLQHSLHLEDLVCWQIQAKQPPSVHPETRLTFKLIELLSQSNRKWI